MSDRTGYPEFAKMIRLGFDARGAPYLVSISGGVAVGKSWTAECLRTLLETGSPPLSVVVVGSDGFLYSNAELDRRGLSARKGFPETYDRDGLAAFLAAVRGRDQDASAPVYSHLVYDVVPGERRPIGTPDVLIVEGLALLGEEVDAYFDFSIFLDADESDMEDWFVRRFLDLLHAGSDDPSSFFSRFAGLGEEDATGVARAVWDGVNGPNLREHILPGRTRAGIIVEKGPDHAIREVRYRP